MRNVIAKAKVTFCALALLLSLGTASNGSAPSTTDQSIGICAGTNFDPQALDVIKKTHIDWLRKGLTWSKTEKTKGQYDWADFDAFVNDAKAHGLKVMAILHDAPRWGIADQKLANLPDAHKQVPNSEYWKEFVTAAAKHYKGKVDAWEIGNEPNGPFFFKGTLDQYRDVVLKDGASALRSVIPHAVIVAPALATSKASKEDRLKELFKPVMENGGAQVPDIISIHVYGTPREIIEAGQTTREIMKANGIGHKQLWLTEFGWNTNNVTEDVQKEHMEHFLQLNDKYHVYDKVFYYRLIDGGKTLTGKPDKHGILHEDLSPKPIMSAF